MRIDMKEIGGSPVLAGAINGQAALVRLIDKVPPRPAGPELLFLDFSAIEVATASYLREALLAFRDYIRGRNAAYYPVIANANDAVKDELIELMTAKRDVYMSCRLDQDGKILEAEPVGLLEPKQQLTFDLVREYGETDAGELMRDHGAVEGTKSTTAWNNRLSSLAGLGLLIETSRGRVKRYRPLFAGD